jgi:TRAP-type C4-dicarboxylate transport system permease small subunit
MVAIINLTLLSLISGSLIVWGSTHAVRGWIRRTTAIGIRYFFINVAIPVAAVILLAYSIKFLVMTIRNEKLKTTAVEERS